MGHEYFFLCLDCKKYWNIGKHHFATKLLPALLDRHKGHKTRTFGEDDGEMSPLLSSYEGEINPFKEEKCLFFSDSNVAMSDKAFDYILRHDDQDVYKKVRDIIYEYNPWLKKRAEARERDEAERNYWINIWAAKGVGTGDNADSDPEADEAFDKAFREARAASSNLK